MPAFPALRFDSDRLAAPARFETFAGGIANFRLGQLGDAAFFARAEAWRIGAIVLSRISSSRLLYERTHEQINAGGADHFYVNFHRRGTVVARFGARPATIGEDALLAIDMRRPIALDVAAEDRYSLAIPRRMLAPRLGGFDAHGLIASGRMVPLLIRTIEGVFASLPDLDVDHGANVEGLVVAIVGATLRDALDQREMAGSMDRALAERARDWIESHLGEPIDVEAVCAALGTSRSRLYRALNGSGGVRALAQRCRLRRLRALLEDRAERRSIAQLGLHCGFADGAYLNRLFKKTYDLTPGEFRQLAHRAEESRAMAGPGRSPSAKFADWVTALS